MTPGLDPELSRLRGGAEAGECRRCPSSEEPSPRLSRVREIIPKSAPWLQRGSEVPGPSIPGDRQRPPPGQGLPGVCLAAPGLPLASCPALKAEVRAGGGNKEGLH